MEMKKRERKLTTSDKTPAPSFEIKDSKDLEKSGSNEKRKHNSNEKKKGSNELSQEKKLEARKSDKEIEKVEKKKGSDEKKRAGDKPEPIKRTTSTGRKLDIVEKEPTTGLKRSGSLGKKKNRCFII